MNHYLIVFDKSTSELLLVEECSSPGEAMKARFRAEQEYKHDPDVEVVVLGARSREALRSTHSRYFDQLTEMASRAVGILKQTPAVA